MVRNYLKFIGFFTLLSDECFGAEGGMPQLNPDYWVSQIFWVILIFGTLYVILWRTILPKINENLENRKSQILTDLDDAQKFKDQSEEKLSEYNKILNQAKQEAKKILEELDKAAKEGKGAAQLDGRMIDAASARMAENIVNINKLIQGK